MRILCTDLDNTIIYSYRHDIGLKKRTVELCRGRAISFISERTYELLKSVQQEMMIVPYQREQKNNTAGSIWAQAALSMRLYATEEYCWPTERERRTGMKTP